MGRYAIRIDKFSAVDATDEQLASYEKFRDAALRVGRFSVFEATESERSATMFDRLCRDPQVAVVPTGSFPWTHVRWRDPAKQAAMLSALTDTKGDRPMGDR